MPNAYHQLFEFKVVNRLSWMLLPLVALLSGCQPNNEPPTPPAPAADVAPLITLQPISQSVTAPAVATFTTTVSGTPTPTLQWQLSTDGTTFNNIASATGSSYSTAATTVANSGSRYRVVATNRASSVTSNVAILTVTAASPGPVNTNTAPTISTQPVAQSVTEPATATFSVTAAGVPAVTYQWQLSTDGVTYNNLGGAVGSNYVTGATSTTQSGYRYRVVVTNSVGAITSSAAILTVTAAPTAPSITTQPGAQTVSEPSAATFSVIATGNPAPAYQWQLSTDGVTYNNLAGASSSSYTTTATTVANTGSRYRVVVTNQVSSVISNAALLTVTPSTAWSTPTAIGGANASQPAIAASPDGYTMIAWVQYDAADQQYNAYARFFDASANVWGNVRSIENLTTNPQSTGYTSKGAYDPRVTLGENGKAAVLVGYALPPNSYGVRLVRHTSSPIQGAPGMETWSDVDTLNSTGENITSHAVSYFSTSSHEDFMSAYVQYDPDNTTLGGAKYRVFSQAYHMPCKGAEACSAFPELRSPTTPETLPGGSGNVSLARIGNDGVAVWAQSWPASRAIWSSRFTGSTAAWSTPLQLNVNSINTAYPPSVASNAAGAAIAAWLELSSGQYQVYASRFGIAGWSAPARLDTAVAPATAINLDSELSGVSVAIDTNGNAVITWTQKETSNGRASVYARNCAAAAALTACVTPVTLENTSDNASWTRVASAPNGDFWAIWKQENVAFEQNVYVSRYSSDTGQWSARALLGGVHLGNNNKPEIAVDGQGRVTVVWSDLNDNRLYFTRYE